MPLPPNDSPFWSIMRDVIRLVFAIIVGCMIYDTVDFAKDFKFIASLALGYGAITGITNAIRKKAGDDKPEP